MLSNNVPSYHIDEHYHRWWWCKENNWTQSKCKQNTSRDTKPMLVLFCRLCAHTFSPICAANVETSFPFRTHSCLVLLSYASSHATLQVHNVRLRVFHLMFCVYVVSLSITFSLSILFLYALSATNSSTYHWCTYNNANMTIPFAYQLDKHFVFSVLSETWSGKHTKTREVVL